MEFSSKLRTRHPTPDTRHLMSVYALTALLALLFFILYPPPCTLASSLSFPEQFEAFDMPGDGGGSIGLSWRAASFDEPTLRYQVYMADQAQGPFTQIVEFAANTHYKSDVDRPWWSWDRNKAYHFYQMKSTQDLRLESGKAYFFKVAVTDGMQTIEGPIRSAIPEPNLFNLAKANNFLLVVFFSTLVLIAIAKAKRHPNIFLRRIPGLDAVEEAIGRATEMGRPILYLTGSDDMSSLSTIAATVILGQVAKKTAAYETELKVPHRDPIVMAICQEIVKESYLEAGRPDAYRDDSNFFITSDQFSYAAAVNGIMLRERPAANFFMGFYYAEALLLAETGAGTGAIQIAGTDADLQLPFFITTCDYTLIGEELYAASAYLSREPVLVGTLRGQDLGKAFLLLSTVIGTILATIGGLAGTQAFVPLLQLFRDFK
ncbi:MAG: hypothetical protein K8G79_00830 [bacterium]|uniref:DUF6754 domain-containing protein n=1 Tax=Candidatus Methylomirabilis tolerans TaxID=3123416 RepID=A0AAJ1AGC3_9BACT|nr:hypothetical protein [Candidatus Methylomirabilis sp.]